MNQWPPYIGIENKNNIVSIRALSLGQKVFQYLFSFLPSAFDRHYCLLQFDLWKLTFQYIILELVRATSRASVLLSSVSHNETESTWLNLNGLTMCLMLIVCFCLGVVYSLYAPAVNFIFSSFFLFYPT